MACCCVDVLGIAFGMIAVYRSDVGAPMQIAPRNMVGDAVSPMAARRTGNHRRAKSGQVPRIRTGWRSPRQRAEPPLGYTSTSRATRRITLDTPGARRHACRTASQLLSGSSPILVIQNSKCRSRCPAWRIRMLRSRSRFLNERRVQDVAQDQVVLSAKNSRFRLPGPRASFNCRKAT